MTREELHQLIALVQSRQTELDFVINYDIEYGMGLGGQSGGIKVE